MRIAEFGVEVWMNRWEHRCRYNLAETCVDSVTVGELLGIAGQDESALAAELAAIRMDYGAIAGTRRLRAAIAALYATVSPERVLVAHGAIGANHLVYEAMVDPGDVVVSVVPTYQQHVAIPESLGADVRQVSLRERDGWRLDLDELAAAADGAALIALTNPNNPTGALLDDAALRAVIAIADRAGAWILADEVYRGLDQVGDGTSASFADLYPRAIAVGSMSKAFSLAGLRLGWITAPADVLAAVSRHRDYSVISVGAVDDLLAAIALEQSDELLARNRAIVRGNLAILDAWVSEEPLVSYARPASGTTAILRIDVPVSSETFCRGLVEREGVLLVPGSAFGLEGSARIGYANEPSVLVDGLERTSRFLGSLAG
jgi:aspartate/methionine/tyrosine aminotransferase